MFKAQNKYTVQSISGMMRPRSAFPTSSSTLGMKLTGVAFVISPRAFLGIAVGGFDDLLEVWFSGSNNALPVPKLAFFPI